MANIHTMLHWLQSGYKARRPSWNESSYLFLQGDLSVDGLVNRRNKLIGDKL